MPEDRAEIHIVGTDDSQAMFQKSADESEVWARALGTNFAAAARESREWAEALGASGQKATNDMRRVRSEQEALEQAWAAAIEENAARVEAAEEAKAKAAELAAKRIELAEEKQMERIAEVAAVAGRVAAGGSVAMIFGGAGELLGLALFGEMLERAIDKTKDEVIELGHLSAATGVSMSWLSQMELEMARIGAVGVNMNMVVMRMSAAIHEAKDPTSREAEALRELGIDAKAAVDGHLTLRDALEQLAVHLQNSTHYEQDLANAREVAGRNAVPLIAFLKSEGEELNKNLEAHHQTSAALAAAGTAAKHLQDTEAMMKEGWQELSAAVLPKVDWALRALIETYNAVASAAASAIEVLIGASEAFLDVIKTTGKAAVDIFKGDMMGAFKDINAGITGVTSDMSAAWQKATLIRDLYLKDRAARQKGFPEEHPSGATDTEDTTGNTKRAQLWDAQLEGEQHHQQAMLAAEKAGIEDRYKLGQLTDTQRATLLDQAAAHELQATQSLIDKKIAIAKTDPENGAEQIIKANAEKQAAQDKYAAALQANTFQELEAIRKKNTEEQNLDNALARAAAERLQKQKELSIKVEEAIAEAARDEAKKRMQVQRIEEQEEIAHATRVYDLQKEKIEAEFAERKITIQQKIALLKQLEEQEYKTQQAAAEKEYTGAVREHGAASPEAATAKAKLDALQDQYHIAMQKMEDDTEKAFLEPVISAITKIGDDLESGLNRWVTGHEKFAKVAEQTWRSIENTALSAIEKQLTKYITAQNLMAIAHAVFKGKEASLDTVTAGMGAALQRAKNLSEATSNAGVAATGAAAGVAAASGPAAPVTGPAAAAAMMASLAPFIALAGAERGWDVPAGGPHPAILHSREMVLPQHLAENVRNMTTSSNSETHNHLHITLGPQTSPGDVDDTINGLRAMHNSGRLRFLFGQA